MSSPLNCSRVRDPILADADIVGPGTLAAFLATATVTTIAVIFAYLLQAVDETYLGSLDNRITTKTHRKWHTTIRRMYTDPSRHPHMSSAAVRAARQEAFTQFILSLSDEQLVTGLAILIAGLSHIRTITGYELTMVHALAWTTSTTHLITLSTLRNYLSTQGLARNARVVSMSALMVLLAILVFIAQPATATGATLPAECTFRSLPSFYSGPGTAFRIVVPLVVALNLTRNYVTRIHALYRRRLEDYPRLKRLFEACTERRLRRDQMYVDMKADGTGRTKQRFQRIAQAGHLYQSSFLSKLPDIAFNFCYGLSAVIYHRWNNKAPRLQHGSINMGFGQIVTLFLLALPVLVALTTYNGEIRAERSILTYD